MIDKKLLKAKIRMIAIRENGLNFISGGDAYVLNVKVFKDHVTADVILIEGDKRDRVNNCEFTFKELGVKE